MSLTPIEHLENKYIRKMKRLNREAFPRQERIAFNKLIELSSRQSFDFLAVKEGDVFVGFFLLAKNPKTVYLFFFAVPKKQQTITTGKALLTSLREYYPYQQIILDLVEIEEGPNTIPRQEKKAFYVANGFHETGHELQQADLKYELLCSSEQFNKESFTSLLEHIAPEVNALKNGMFSPVVREIKRR